MMAELANCLNCNAVFVKTNHPICRDCFQKEEEAFEKVYQFLMKQKNREATLAEIVEATGVEEELIIKFLKENRLRAKDFPNLKYPCEKCGARISSGRLCTDCSSHIINELATQEELEQKLQKRKKESNEENVYYTFKTDRK